MARIMEKFWKYGFLTLLCFWITTGCSRPIASEGVISEAIPINEYASNSIDAEAVLDSCRAVVLPDSLLIGSIRDLACNDGRAFLIDDRNQLCGIDLTSGKSQCVNYTGQGPGEYIEPTGITTWDKGCGVTDLASRRLIIYDRELHYVKTIPLPATSIKAIKTEDRLIIQNLSLDLWPKEFVVADPVGSVIGAYVDADPDVAPQFLQPAYMMEVDGNSLLFSSPSLNLYRVDERIEPYITFDFGSNGETKDSSGALNYSKATLNTATFVVNGWIINSLLYSGKRYYSFIGARNERIAGALTEAFGYPFFPRWQSDNSLIGHYQADSDSADKLLLFFPKSSTPKSR